MLLGNEAGAYDNLLPRHAYVVTPGFPGDASEWAVVGSEFSVTLPTGQKLWLHVTVVDKLGSDGWVVFASIPPEHNAIVRCELWPADSGKNCIIRRTA